MAKRHHRKAGVGQLSARASVGLAVATLLFTLSPGQAAQSPSPCAASVPLLVTDHAGVRRAGEPVRSGIPLPQGGLEAANRARLLAPNGEVVAASFQALDSWPDGSVRWLLVDFTAEVAARGTERYRLQFGGGQCDAGVEVAAVAIEERTDSLIVDTGAARFTIDKVRFGPFRSVRVGDQERVDGTASGLRAVIDRPFSSNVTFDPGNSRPPRRLAFPYVARTGAETKTQDWVLTFGERRAEQGRSFQLEGSVTGAEGEGTTKTDFTSTNQQLRILPSQSDWRQHVDAEQGDRLFFSSYAAGEILDQPEVHETLVEERGRHAVILQRGTLRSSKVKHGALDFTARLHFDHGHARAVVDLRLENHHYSVRIGDNVHQNSSTYIEQPSTLFLEDVSLSLATKSERPRVSIPSERKAFVERRLEGELTLYQDSSGGKAWARKQGKAPRHASHVSFRGYVLERDGAVVEKGRRAPGALELAGERGGGVVVAVRDFWQNFPKALRADSAGTVEIALFPREYAASHPLRAGEYKRHTVLFDFSGASAEELVLRFQAPLMAFTPPEWTASTEALWLFLERDNNEHYDVWERKNEASIDAKKSANAQSLLTQREAVDFYGWNDYGDVPTDFECADGPWNLKYDFDFGMFVQHARSLDPRWWSFAMAGARHKTEIDVLHQPTLPFPHFGTGGAYEHSRHGECGYENPNRNRGGISADLSFGVKGALTAYRYTGDRFFRETGLELSQNTLYLAEAGFLPNNNPRATFSATSTLVPAYLLTGDARFRELVERILASPHNIHEKYGMAWAAGYMTNLGRYLDVHDSPELVTLLGRLADRIMESPPVPRRRNGCLASNNRFGPDFYNLMIADAFAYAYRHSGEERYLVEARRQFACGQDRIDFLWAESGRIGWTGHHTAQAAATFGHVFLYVDARARAEGVSPESR